MISTMPPPTKTKENEIALSLTGRPYVSWSQLTSFRMCPRKWHYSHIEVVDPEFVASSLVFGSAFHSAAQHYYEQQLAGVVCEASELYDVFDQARNDERNAGLPVKYNKTENEEQLLELSQRMLAAFLESELAKPKGQVIGVEETLTGSISPDLPDLLARIDLIVQREDWVQVIDLKTSKSRWSEHKANQSADQLMLYAEMANQLSDGQPIGIAFGVVTKAKSPAVQLLLVECDSQRVKQSIALMEPIWQAMKSGVDYTNPGPMNCSTCPFQSRCPAYRGN